MHRILLIDPCVDTLESLAFLLRTWGHDVRVARDGLSALRIAGSYVPSVVLTEIRLPQLNGYEVARRLRAMPALDGVLLVAVSGCAAANHTHLCREAGFDEQFSKPLPPETLRSYLDGSEVPEAEPPYRDCAGSNSVTFSLLGG